MTWHWWMLAGLALSAGFTAIVCKVMRSVEGSGTRKGAVMEREWGYWFVKTKPAEGGTWEVARWEGAHWTMAGIINSGIIFDDSDFDEIGHLVTMPDDQEDQ